MKVTVINYNTGKELLVFKLSNMPGKPESYKMRQILLQIKNMQAEKDVLGLNVPCIITGDGCGLGIKSFFCTPYGINTIAKSKENFVKFMGNDSIIYDREYVTDTPAPVQILLPDGSRADTTLKIGVMAELEGFVINCGRYVHNIFGKSSTSYFKKFSKTTIYRSAKSGAKLFVNPTDVLKYIKNNELVFKCMAEDGDNMSVEYISEDIEPEYWDLLSEKQKVKQKKALQEIAELFERFSKEADEKENNNRYFGETQKDEAIRRLRKIGVMDEVVENFKNDKLMISESAGILYDLNDRAKAAIEKMKEYSADALPYHLIHSFTEFGELYAVLFVSSNRDDWPSDGPDREGYVFSYVYNATDPSFSEYGDIVIQGANGGVVRTA